jgi:hypothetical protein
MHKELLGQQPAKRLPKSAQRARDSTRYYLAQLVTFAVMATFASLKLCQRQRKSVLSVQMEISSPVIASTAGVTSLEPNYAQR